MTAARHGLSDAEADRLQTRALAKWLVSGGDDNAWSLPEDAITELREDEGRLYVVVTAVGGVALARYRVVRRGGRWSLHTAPLHSLPPLPATGDSPAPFARSAALRSRSELLALRSAALRWRSQTLLEQVRGYARSPAPGRGTDEATVRVA